MNRGMMIGLGLVGLTLWAVPWWRERQWRTLQANVAAAEVALSTAQQRHEQAQQALADAQERQQHYEHQQAAQAELAATHQQIQQQLAALQMQRDTVHRKLQTAVARVQSQAQGWQLEELELADGRKLRGITLQRVTSEGIVFSQPTGEIQVRWPSLPLDFVERFHPETAPARASQERAAFKTWETSKEPPFGPDDLDPPTS